MARTDDPLIPRRLLLILVFSLPPLVVAFGVVSGGYVLSTAVADSPGASGLWWTAVVLLMLLIADVVLLVGVLGVHALADTDTDEPSRRE